MQTIYVIVKADTLELMWSGFFSDYNTAQNFIDNTNRKNLNCVVKPLTQM